MTALPDAGVLPERLPQVGELVQVRSRRWLVEEVIPAPAPGQSPLIRLACADDDAQGQALDAYWDYELDRLILSDEGWQNLAQKGFDSPSRFGAFLHTLRWNCITATEPSLFQAPFRAGIKIDAYQMSTGTEFSPPIGIENSPPWVDQLTASVACGRARL